MNVTIYSRKAFEERLLEGPLENTAVINFYSPNTKQTPSDFGALDCSQPGLFVFPVPVYDIDLEVLPEYGLTYDTYLPEANLLASFIKIAVKHNLDIICQCEFGQSRSAACAAAILEYFEQNGISVFADYRYYPNQLIFNKMLDALRAKGKDDLTP